MNGAYISRALCFHGQPLQKIWEDERGSGDLQKWGVDPNDTDYTIYQERQKFFTFQDRAKRLKMHQFFARKALDLYDKNLKADVSSFGISDIERLKKLDNARPFIAAVPPFEAFINKNQDKFKRLRYLLEGLSSGDVIYGVVIKNYHIQALSQASLMVKPLCTAEPLVRYLGDVAIKGAVQRQLIIKPLDKQGNPRNYLTNDFVCCEVVGVSVDADRLNLSMKSKFSKNKDINFGLVSADELPEYYRITNNNALEKYDDCLQKTKEFHNPNYDVLYELMGLDSRETYTLMHKLRHPFPMEEYAKELRQAQASKWAFRSVAEGIEHFKVGRHVEAFQCLNKALNIDPRNVEGLVARGALYANKGSFLKAVDDFEKALKLNSFHVNARKYMGETLVALGRSYEEDNRLDDAIKAYRNCLNLIPNHEQARLSLEALQNRPESNLFDNLLNISGTSLSKAEKVDIDMMSKNKKNKSNQFGTSSSDTDSTENETDSDSGSSGKSHERATKKDISLSPLSKRMSQSAAADASLPTTSRNPYSQPFYMTNQTLLDSGHLQCSSNDFKLDDDDTETRVRKLLQDASKYKKQKTKKSKKKKSKKSKKESKKIKPTLLTDNSSAAYWGDSFQSIGDFNMESRISGDLQLYEQSVPKIKTRTELETVSTNTAISREDTPPPKAPSMTLHEEQIPPPPPIINNAIAFKSSPTVSRIIRDKEETPRFSFTIKRPVKVDKFGLVRIATPLANTNQSPSPSCSRSRSRSRSNSRYRRYRRSDSRDILIQSRGGGSSRNYRHRSHSRSLSVEKRSRGGRRRFRSRSSRSRSRDHYRRSRSRSRSGRRYQYRRRRTPSPFVPRATPPPRRYRSRSHESKSFSRKNSHKSFGNRVWQRPGYKPSGESACSVSRWSHDKFDKNGNSETKPDEESTIEEIDEIINQAQKERKKEIIKRDKGLLKKST